MGNHKKTRKPGADLPFPFQRENRLLPQENILRPFFVRTQERKSASVPETIFLFRL
jgi:hypothetical protein